MKKKVNWTQEQVDLLTQMAYDGARNADIATAVGKTVEDVHHKRSHLGLTIAKIEVERAAKATTKPVKKAPAAKAAPATKKMAKAAAEAAAAVDKPAKNKEKPCEYTYSISMTTPQILDTLRRCSEPRRSDGFKADGSSCGAGVGCMV